ncbi:MAG: MarR family winged helix-turn-helix transcriptional regulator [Armatimonadota bacterium]|jgi:DNA-binding MarR family transcriptional regulator
MRRSESIIALAAEINASFSQSIKPLLASHGITHSDFELLSLIWSADGRSNQSDLSRALGLSRATVSEAVGNLVKRGLVLKSESESDKRMVQIILTSTAHRIMGELAIELKNLEAHWNQSLSQREYESTTKGLRKLLDQSNS